MDCHEPVEEWKFSQIKAELTFSYFTQLPPELRDEVWGFALAEYLEPVLFFYERGCWQPHEVTPIGEDSDPDSTDVNLNFAFEHERLRPSQLRPSLLSVNRESQAFTLAWLKSQGMYTESVNEEQSLWNFSTSFRPSKDALYVPMDRLSDFITEADDRLVERDMRWRLFRIVWPKLRRIAIPAEACTEDWGQRILGILTKEYSTTTDLWIVAEPTPRTSFIAGKSRLQQRWTVREPAENVAVKYKQLLEEFKRVFSTDIGYGQRSDINIRLVVAIRFP